MTAEPQPIEHNKGQEPNTVEVHVLLEGITPAIWRRLLVPLDTTLAQFHLVLQAAMGWADAHLHEFLIGGLRYGDVAVLNEDRLEIEAQALDERQVRLMDFADKADTVFLYVYDFGDNWRHRVTLVKRLAVRPRLKSAHCIGGARCCPPEDVGGTLGYDRFLRIVSWRGRG